MTTLATENGSTSTILDWLAAQPSTDVAEEIGQLHHYLEQLRSPSVSPVQHHRCVELFYGRTLRIAADLKPRLMEAGLPLERGIHNHARQLIEALEAVAKAFQQVILNVRSGTIRPLRRLGETLAARGIRMLSEASELAGLAGGLPLPGLWPTACQLFETSGEDPTATTDGDSAGESAQFAFKRLVALDTLQLERFSQPEIIWICEYLNRIATLLQLDTRPPTGGETSWYWLLAGSEEGPQSFQRKPPPNAQKLIFASSSPLAKRVAEHIARLEAGQQPFELNLPKIAVGAQPMALLQRLRNEWALPSKREQPRRKTHYTVQACTGIEAIWTALRHPGATMANNRAVVQEWQVVNESPGGYAIMYVAGNVDGLSAGMTVALRREDEEPWNICVVRWIRSENPSQIELGLQIVSTGATPVMVGFRGAQSRSNKMVNALVLPAMPALRHHPAILAPSGTYTSRRFALVSDLDRVYVAQGRLLSLDIQTANIELFQFEIDPYPI